VAAVQANRLQAVRSLAQRHGCVVLLKGSGSLIAAPGQATVINPTGNALLASGGTGDALAGWLGGVWAQFPAASDGHAAAQQAAVATAWLHGRAADVALSRATGRRVLSAGDLILAMSERAAQRGAA
jgi:NAD(P)H-hydrate repair Nnr-like enzyme with NAD(P)H-hydrate dehydratase domain